MSRSIRRPYTTWTGTNSAKDDKRVSARGTRRAQDRVLRMAPDYDALVLPDRRVCTWGDVWSWSRDGKQHLVLPPKPRHMDWYFNEDWFKARQEEYVRLHRK